MRELSLGLTKERVGFGSGIPSMAFAIMHFYFLIQDIDSTLLSLGFTVIFISFGSLV